MQIYQILLKIAIENAYFLQNFNEEACMWLFVKESRKIFSRSCEKILCAIDKGGHVDNGKGAM